MYKTKYLHRTHHGTVPKIALYIIMNTIWSSKFRINSLASVKNLSRYRFWDL